MRLACLFRHPASKAGMTIKEHALTVLNRH